MATDAELWQAIREANDAVREVQDTASVEAFTEKWRAEFDASLQRQAVAA